MSASPKIRELFRLVEVAETDHVTVGDDGFDLRIEVFRSQKRKNAFRVRFWRTEFFRIQSTFPQSSGCPAHQPSDEQILVDAEHNFGKRDWDNVRATSSKKVLQTAIAAVNRWLAHVHGG